MKEYIISFMPVFLFLFLIAASLYDLLNDKEIPLSIGIVGIIIRMIELIIFEPNNIKHYLFISIIIFFVMATGAVLGAIGGADCIYGAMICFYLGNYGLYIIMLAFILTLPVALYIKKKNKTENKKMEFPFVPYLLFSTAIVVMYLLKGGF